MPKIKLSKSLVDFYENYPHKESVNRSTYRLILRTFNYLLMKSMIDEGKIYHLPNSLGVLGVFKIPVIGRGVFDYQLYKKEGVKVWKKNLHSSSYSAQFTWKLFKPRMPLPRRVSTSYKWTAPRYWKRYLAKSIKLRNTINLYYDKHGY